MVSLRAAPPPADPARIRPVKYVTDATQIMFLILTVILCVLVVKVFLLDRSRD